jgi:hypothetical protein
MSLDPWLSGFLVGVYTTVVFWLTAATFSQYDE